MLMYDDLSTSSAPPEFLSSTLMTSPASTGAQHYLTIEELKLARNSCWLCGCNWQQDHASLDCPECDGYSLSRPCPSCDGKCKQVWKRNISGTHDHHRASWVGQCNMMTNGSKDKAKQVRAFEFGSLCDGSSSTSTSTSTSGGRGCAAGTGPASSPVVGPTASSVCSSAPSSAVSSDCESDCHTSCESPAASGRVQQPTKSQQQQQQQQQQQKQQQQSQPPPQPQPQPQKSKGQQHQPNHLCPCN